MSIAILSGELPHYSSFS